MHQPVTSWCAVTSWADHMVVACTYCMRSKVSSLSQIYLYSSYFGGLGRHGTDNYDHVSVAAYKVAKASAVVSQPRTI
jgi:hypothetical protein